MTVVAVVARKHLIPIGGNRHQVSHRGDAQLNGKLLPNSDNADEADRISMAANKKTGTDIAGPV